MKSGYLKEAERRRDGRNVDDALGVLSGEGAHQRVERIEEPFPAKALQPQTAPAEVVGESPTYYGQPVLKQTVWKASVPLYFFVGGMAGAAATLGIAADFAGRGRLHRLAVRCSWVGAGGGAIGTALLIHDLGRPERFLNMLRVFRIRSPMSVGSWILAAGGALNGAAVVLAPLTGPLALVGRVARNAAGLLGPLLSGYSAVLLTNTANPVWQRTWGSLPFLFMSSSMASCGAVMDLLPQHKHERRVTQLYARAGAALSLVSSTVVGREVKRAEALGNELTSGSPGRWWKAYKISTTVGLALSFASPRMRWARVASNLLIAGGSLAARFAIFYAGKASARDPQATFRPQRQGLGAAEVGPASKVLRDWRPDTFALPVIR